MSDATIDRLRGKVGETVESIDDFTVEAGKVAEFVDAIGDEDPIYRDASVATD